VLPLLISFFVVGLGVLRPSAPAAGQTSDPLIGTWEGKLDAGGTSLRVVFHVTATADGKLAATMDSPDQGATGIPVSEVEHDGTKVHIGVAVVHGAFDGTMSEDAKSIAGTWAQGAASLPLTVSRVAKSRSAR
jgi:hypothetical protein